MGPVYYETISIEELPSLDASRSLLPVLMPTSIDEEDDPRSLLYIFDDNDVQRAAAVYAVVKAEALESQVEQQIQQQRRREQALEKRLEQLLDQDEAFVDLIGRRLCAINGYDVPDLWNSHGHGLGEQGSSHDSSIPIQHHAYLRRVPDGLYSDLHEDDWDLDWLGRELLSGREGADVWIIEADSSPHEDIAYTQHVPSSLHQDDLDSELQSVPIHVATVTSEAQEPETQDSTERPRKTVKITDLRS